MTQRGQRSTSTNMAELLMFSNPHKLRLRSFSHNHLNSRPTGVASLCTGLVKALWALIEQSWLELSQWISLGRKTAVGCLKILVQERGQSNQVSLKLPFPRTLVLPTERGRPYKTYTAGQLRIKAVFQNNKVQDSFHAFLFIFSYFL